MSLVSNSIREMLRALLPRSLRSHAIAAGPLRGLRIQTSWHNYPGAILGTTERKLLAWLASNVNLGEVWLDVGAHYGYTAVALAKGVGVSGRVFAFEPVLASAGCISTTRRLNQLDQIEVVPLGLSADADLRSWRIPVVRGMADSTLADSNLTETIYCISLDALWPFLCGSRIHGVKIDVQGMELDVLRGMRDTLVRWQPKLTIEFHRGVDRIPILELLDSLGYSSPVSIETSESAELLADDHSYAFLPEAIRCAS
jgi:FkbM family methyltransferase